MRTFALLVMLLAAPPIPAGAQAPEAARETVTDRDLASNINARYTVESVEISGVPDGRVSQPLRDDLQALVGQRLDPDAAERLDARLAGELPGYRVRRRMARGSAPGSIRLVFQMIESEARWIPFAAPASKFVYHSKLGWSGLLDIPVGGEYHRVTVGLALDNGDDLLEEYSGYGFRIESRRLATERLGASLRVSRFHETWRPETLSALAADPGLPEAYRTRLEVEPLLTVALMPGLRVTGGVSVSELESLSRAPSSQMANAALFAIAFDRAWTSASGLGHDLGAAYRLRSGREALESDYAYTRHAAQARYELERGRSTVVAAFAAGGISGTAPLFERFSLGDSSTLRGWNRFDVAPAGGDRMFHQTVEYRYRGLALFLDTGAVWNDGTDRRIRASTGFGYHGDHAFVTLGFPLNADGVSTAFMMGVRF